MGDLQKSPRGSHALPSAIDPALFVLPDNDFIPTTLDVMTGQHGEVEVARGADRPASSTRTPVSSSSSSSSKSRGRPSLEICHPAETSSSLPLHPPSSPSSSSPTSLLFRRHKSPLSPVGFARNRSKEQLQQQQHVLPQQQQSRLQQHWLSLQQAVNLGNYKLGRKGVEDSKSGARQSGTATTDATTTVAAAAESLGMKFSVGLGPSPSIDGRLRPSHDPFNSTNSDGMSDRDKVAVMASSISSSSPSSVSPKAAGNTFPEAFSLAGGSSSGGSSPSSSSSSSPRLFFGSPAASPTKQKVALVVPGLPASMSARAHKRTGSADSMMLAQVMRRGGNVAPNQLPPRSPRSPLSRESQECSPTGLPSASGLDHGTKPVHPPAPSSTPSSPSFSSSALGQPLPSAAARLGSSAQLLRVPASAALSPHGGEHPHHPTASLNAMPSFSSLVVSRAEPASAPSAAGDAASPSSAVCPVPGSAAAACPHPSSVEQHQQHRHNHHSNHHHHLASASVALPGAAAAAGKPQRRRPQLEGGVGRARAIRSGSVDMDVDNGQMNLSQFDVSGQGQKHLLARALLVPPESSLVTSAAGLASTVQPSEPHAAAATKLLQQQLEQQQGSRPSSHSLQRSARAAVAAAAAAAAAGDMLGASGPRSPMNIHMRKSVLGEGGGRGGGMVAASRPRRGHMHRKSFDCGSGVAADFSITEGRDLKPSDYVLRKPYEDVRAAYGFHVKQLGAGQFGVVRECVEIATGNVYACKIIDKSYIKKKEDADDIRKEVACLTLFRKHPTIVTLRNTFEDEENIYIVMDLCKGGDLFDRIVERQQYSEEDAAAVCRSLVEALLHCHCHGVIHRDIKPENILLVGRESNTRIKLVDFGVATTFIPGKPVTEFMGTPEYMAPEVLLRSYGPEADIWSAGVVLYVTLCGVPPFWASSNWSVMDSILKDDVSFRSAKWANVSDEAKDLVRRMLIKNPRRRITAPEILGHPWIQQCAP